MIPTFKELKRCKMKTKSKGNFGIKIKSESVASLISFCGIFFDITQNETT